MFNRRSLWVFVLIPRFYVTYLPKKCILYVYDGIGDVFLDVLCLCQTIAVSSKCYLFIVFDLNQSYLQVLNIYRQHCFILTMTSCHGYMLLDLCERNLPITGRFSQERTSKAECWCFLWCVPDKRQTVGVTGDWDALIFMWRHNNVNYTCYFTHTISFFIPEVLNIIGFKPTSLYFKLIFHSPDRGAFFVFRDHISAGWNNYNIIDILN